MRFTISILCFFIILSCSNSSKNNINNDQSFDPSDQMVHDHMSVPGPLKFHDDDFYLMYSDHPEDNYYIQEYLPKNETLADFKQMLTIHIFETDSDLQQAVDYKVSELEERKKIDNQCRYFVTKRPDGKEINIEFFVSQSDKDGQNPILEFNLYQYKNIMVKGDKNAVRIFAYSKRFYGDEISASEKNWDEERKYHFYEMNGLVKPDILME